MQTGLEKKQTRNMLTKVQLELSQETDLLSFSPFTARIDVSSRTWHWKLMQQTNFFIITRRGDSWDRG